jgi:pSer/pThr/pTyr-binding forkhead associated (FHA) protein
MADPQLTFLVKEPGAEPRRVTIATNVVKIGKGASLPLALTNPDMSRMHAVIEVHEGELSLIDLGSEPQTAVNGVPIKKHPLRPGDQIQIAGSVIVLEGFSESVPAAEEAWNWGAAPAPRKERGNGGPVVFIVLFLLGVVGFLVLR